MKILFITNNYKPYSGGVVSSIDAFRYQLKQQGHHVKVVTLDFLGNSLEEHDVIRLSCPIRFSYKNNPIAIPLFMHQQLEAIMEKEAPDIVHAHHPFALGAAAVKIAKRKGIPTVFTHHTQYGPYTDHYIPVFKSAARHFVERQVQSFCRLVDRIIVPTPSIKRQLQIKKVTTPLHVIPTGILPVFVWKDKPLKKQSENYFEVLTVSRFAPEKNIPFLLDMMTFLDKRFRLTLVGFGPQLEYLKTYAFDTCQLSPENISFVVKPSKTVIANYYRKADVFVLASTTETQGLVCTESMAAGTPVVAVRAPGSQDCVHDGKNGFLVETPREMAEKVKLLVDDQELYNNIHEHAWKTAQNYAIDSTTDQLVSVYQALLV